MFHLEFPQKYLRYGLLLIIVLNFLFLAGSALINSNLLPAHSYLNHILILFDLSIENNLAAWYSSMLLFSSAIMSLVCFFSEWDKPGTGMTRYINIGWIIFALIFALLSFDELGSVHENIAESGLFKASGKALLNNHSSGWLVFMGVVVLVSLFMLTFCILRLTFDKWAAIFFITGLLCYLSNPFQENFEIAAHQAAPNPETWKRPLFFLLLEEGSEIFGSLFFLVSVTLYAIKSKSEQANRLYLEFDYSVLSRFVGLVFVAGAVGLLLTEVIFGNVIGDVQTGVPKNWFTAVIGFIVACYCGIRLGSFSNAKIKAILIITGFISITLSVYFGSNLYAYPIAISSQGMLRRTILVYFLSIASSVPAVYLIGFGGKSKTVIGSIIWLLICFAIFSNPRHAVDLAFVPFCGLFYALTQFSSASFDKIKNPSVTGFNSRQLSNKGAS